MVVDIVCGTICGVVLVVVVVVDKPATPRIRIYCLLYRVLDHEKESISTALFTINSQSFEIHWIVNVVQHFCKVWILSHTRVNDTSSASSHTLTKTRHNSSYKMWMDTPRLLAFPWSFHTKTRMKKTVMKDQFDVKISMSSVSRCFAVSWKSQ